MSELDKKYYTPSIEEFHVGFEFEKLEGLEWFSHNIPPHYRVFSLGDELTNYRVKFLDREDIESLGWNYTHSKNIFGLSKFGDSLFFNRTCNKLNYELTLVEQGRILILLRGFFSKGLDFLNIDIDIKNKSELKRLMKQSRIE